MTEVKLVHEDTSNDNDEYVVEHSQHQQLKPRVVEVRCMINDSHHD